MDETEGSVLERDDLEAFQCSQRHQAGNAHLNRPIKGLERHTRQRVRRLKAVANIVHSAATLTRPRSRNLRAPCCSLMIPKTGSTSCFLTP